MDIFSHLLIYISKSIFVSLISDSFCLIAPHLSQLGIVHYIYTNLPI